MAPCASRVQPKPIWELSLTEPGSGVRAQRDDLSASNMTIAGGNDGGATLRERLVALRQERQRLVVDAVCAEAAKMLGEPDPWSVDQDLAFSELGFDSQMTVTLCKRLAAVTGLRLPETVGWDYGSISGLAQYLEAELAGGHGRLKSAGPVNSGATGLWAIEEQLNKVEELVAVIADGEKQRVADRLRALLGTIAGSEAGLGKLIQAASTPDEIFQLIDSELGK